MTDLRPNPFLTAALVTAAGGFAFLWFRYPQGWIRMWILAITIGLALKCLTFLDALRLGLNPSIGRVLSWFLAWPGMDGRAFFTAAADPATRVEWVRAITHATCGFVLLYGVASSVYPIHPLLAGWAGMIGMVLILHFGVFHLLSLFWRWQGVAAAPIMRQPLRAASLTEFWGSRWNTGFSTPARRLWLRPLARKYASPLVPLSVYLLSGFIHEVVITLPAGGGYGLPTAYFTLQGLAAAFQRTATARRFGIHGGVLGWSFTMLVAAAPVWWLFPPIFIQNVILPMLHAIGALEGPI